MIGVRGFLLCLALASAAVASAETITLDRLESILSASKKEPIKFEELRESPWLETAEHSHGTMHALPDFLEKRVEFPRNEIWRLYADRIVRVEYSEGEAQEVSFGNSEQIAVFANALQRIAIGQFSELKSAFQLSLTGDEGDWSVRFKPRSADVQQYLEWIEATGNGSALRKIIVMEPGGDRTTTRFSVSRN